MNSTLLYTLMLLAAIIMAVLPFGVLMGLGSTLGIDGTDFRIIAAYIFIACAVSYLTSFGSFALIQKSNCKEVKNLRQIALNAGIALLFQIGIFAIVGIIPWFRNVVGNLLPPDTDAVVKLAVVFAYYSAWAAGFGFALGGTLSSSCAVATEESESLFPKEESFVSSNTNPVPDQLGAIPDE